MLKAVFDKIAILSFENLDNAKMHIFMDGKDIGYVKSLSFETEADFYIGFEFCTRDINLTKDGLIGAWAGAVVQPESQKVPLDIIIKEEEKVTGILKNCWISKGDLKKSQWVCEEFQSMIVFSDIL